MDGSCVVGGGLHGGRVMMLSLSALRRRLVSEGRTVGAVPGDFACSLSTWWSCRSRTPQQRSSGSTSTTWSAASLGFSKALDKDVGLPESVLEKTHEAHYQVAEFTLIVMDAWKVR